MGSGRARDRTGFRRLVAALAGAVVLAGCGGSGPTAGSPTEARTTTPSPGHAATASAPALDCDGGGQARTIWFPAGDGTRLYGALVGSGRVGVVVANDVPHQLCETLTPARFLAAHGYAVLSFDYRDHGLSDRSEAPGRLDLDVAGAVAELRSRGAARVILLGSYAGVAAAVVAATEITPPVDGVIGISPAAARGQWVQGPFGPIGAFQAAPRLRIPVLYITVRTDPYVSMDEVGRLFRLTAGPSKDLVVIPAGSAGFDTIDFNSYEPRVRGAILSFIRRVAPVRSA
jgi:pimeloyl-ACP methyl ester carboxylesterase